MELVKVGLAFPFPNCKPAEQQIPRSRESTLGKHEAVCDRETSNHLQSLSKAHLINSLMRKQSYIYFVCPWI
jgi:hypothetical protein